MKKIFLVDTENVNLSSLNECSKLTSSDVILLFVTDNTDSTSYSDSKVKSLSTKAHIMKIVITVSGKNGLDFQLVTYLGLLVGLNLNKSESNDYYIISNDKGFLNSISLLSNCYNQKIELINSISAIFNNNLSSTKANKSLITKFINLGFNDKESINLLNILYNSKTFNAATNNFWLHFNLNNELLNTCTPILEEYFNITKESCITNDLSNFDFDFNHEAILDL